MTRCPITGFVPVLRTKLSSYPYDAAHFTGNNVIFCDDIVEYRFGNVGKNAGSLMYQFFGIIIFFCLLFY